MYRLVHCFETLAQKSAFLGASRFRDENFDKLTYMLTTLGPTPQARRSPRPSVSGGPVTALQGCRGDGISIPIPIPCPQKIMWVSS